MRVLVLFLFVVITPMPNTTPYEATRSIGLEPMTLIFHAGKYEALPFEIRLMAPWYGSFDVELDYLRPWHREQISRLGYAIIREADWIQNAA